MSSLRPDPNRITLAEIVGRHFLPSIDGSEKHNARAAFVRDQARRILHQNIDIADRKFESSGKTEVLKDFDDYFSGTADQTIHSIQQLDEEHREAVLEQMAKIPATAIRQRIREIVIAARSKKAR
jgi:hypothetical protein